MMRLIDTSTFELQSGFQDRFKQEGYAILSHRWDGAEIIFDQLPQYTQELRTATRPLRTPQLDKIRGACDQARSDGIKWMWIDTCCINKNNSTEESESINSMFNWYREAKVCYTYFNDVEKTSGGGDAGLFNATGTGKPSVWFTRGWTLQELLAPVKMLFYDKHWKYLGTRAELSGILSAITGIQTAYLTGQEDFRKACIAQKMSWMADRTTTREEDMAYSMLGIFGINLNPQYGEGARAFMRLQESLLQRSTDESLFAWRMPANVAKDGVQSWGLLANSPSWFKDSKSIVVLPEKVTLRPSGGFSMRQQGVYASVPTWTRFERGFMFAASFPVACSLVGIPIYYWLVNKRSRNFCLGLNCWARASNGELSQVKIDMRLLTTPPSATFRRLRPTQFSHSGAAKTTLIEGTVLQPNHF